LSRIFAGFLGLLFLTVVEKCVSADSAKPLRGLTDVAFVDGRFGVAFFEFTPYAPEGA